MAATSASMAAAACFSAFLHRVASSGRFDYASIFPICPPPRPAHLCSSERLVAPIPAMIKQSRRSRHRAVSQDEAAVPDLEEEVEQEAKSPHLKLYFGNLPYNCDSAQLAGIIQEYATPEMVEVLYDRDSGRSRGFAFVTMPTIEDCELIIQNLNGKQFGGRVIMVNFSDQPRSREPLYPETEYKLFVGNLSWSATSEDLKQLFEQCGAVVGARIIYDGETGRSRGYGFVCYSTKEEMDVAMESLNGAELQGRSLRISVATGRSRF